jgi:Na+-transporting NADH:ubiquinone oxidoreductase subunit C
VLKDNMKSIIFALVMCVVCSVLLSGAASLLKSRQAENIELDIKKNILKALAISGDFSSMEKDALRKLYTQNVKEIVVSEDGTVQDGMIPSDIKDGDVSKLPVYQKLSGSTVSAYAIPIEGKGLWSTIRGYLALESDLNTVLGVTFYDQTETAGLGAEIAQGWFQDRWVGKKILSADGSLKSITIAKGTVNPASPDASHMVDGISGATMTGTGINNFVKSDLIKYQSYFSKARK